MVSGLMVALPAFSAPLNLPPSEKRLSSEKLPSIQSIQSMFRLSETRTTLPRILKEGATQHAHPLVLVKPAGQQDCAAAALRHEDSICALPR